MTAVPAVVLELNETTPLLSSVELPAVAVSFAPPESPNCTMPPRALMIVALPAVVAAKNAVLPPLLLRMPALPADAVSVPIRATPNVVVPPLLLTIVALPAVLWFWKLVLPPELLAIVAFNAELWARKLAVPKLLLVM